MFKRKTLRVEIFHTMNGTNRNFWSKKEQYPIFLQSKYKNTSYIACHNYFHLQHCLHSHHRTWIFFVKCRYQLTVFGLLLLYKSNIKNHIHTISKNHISQFNENFSENYSVRRKKFLLKKILMLTLLRQHHKRSIINRLKCYNKVTLLYTKCHFNLGKKNWSWLTTSIKT